MASMKLGSKQESFELDGQTWLCTSGLSSDVIIEVGEMSFHLHKFPLLSRSGVLENLIGDSSGEDKKSHTLKLDDIPGGAKAFLLVAKFCYGIKLELTPSNVVALRCAADYLQMNDEYGQSNLIAQTETFLDQVFTNWADTILTLETCEEILTYAEELHIVSRCIDSLASKSCADPSLFSWPVQAPLEGDTIVWNGIRTTTKPFLLCDDWWFEDTSSLKLPLYKRLIRNLEARDMKPEKIVGSLVLYANRHLPLLGRNNGKSISTSLPNTDQRILLEEIVGLLPTKMGIVPTNFLLRLLRTSIIFHASPSCQENLEKRVGAQLDDVALEDLLIPNTGYSAETLYDIDCVQRIFEQFLVLDDEADCSNLNCIVEECQLMGSESRSLTRMTMVANLVDGYLAEVAPDANLKLAKFVSLAGGVPEYARPLDDGIYRAVDIYLKAHPWLMDSEREHLCRLMNCQKFSLEASTHAAQNERLPLRVIVQVLFFEQLRLRTSLASWFFISDNLDGCGSSSTAHNPGMELALARTDVAPALPARDRGAVSADKMRERVVELEKECVGMKQELEKLVSEKGGWNLFCKRLGFRPCNPSVASKGGKSSKGLRRAGTRGASGC